MEGFVAVAGDDLHQAFFAELAEVVLGFGDAVGVGDEDVSGLHDEAVFFVVHAVHEADDGAPFVETANAAVAAEDEGRQLPCVRVGQLRSGLRCSARGRGWRTSPVGCCDRGGG